MEQLPRRLSFFFSSTFLDMQKERDIIVTVVLPELRHRLSGLPIDLVDVDLRWGVKELEDDLISTTNKWHYCKAAIDRTDHYFVGILGHRYGHPQKASDLEDRDFAASPVRKNSCIGKSLTEIEIMYATQNFESHENRKDLFFFRESSLKLEPGVRPLRDKVVAYAERHDVEVQNYHVGHTTNEPQLGSFAEQLTRSLWGRIYLDHLVPILKDNFLGGSADFVEKFSFHAWEEVKKGLIAKLIAGSGALTRFNTPIQWSTHFYGRTKELKSLREYLYDQNREPFWVSGPSGIGKSSLVAQVLFSATQEGAFICLSRFIGQDAEITSQHDLMVSLTNELVSISGFNDKNLGVEALFSKQLQEFKEKQKEEKLIIIIDALDQLETPSEHSWLPEELPPSVKILLTSIDVPESWKDSVQLTLGSFAENDKKDYIHHFLDAYSKSLSKAQIEAITKLPQSGNPLYLSVLLKELRSEHTVTDDEERLKYLIEQLDSEIYEEEIIRVELLAKRYPEVSDIFSWVLKKCERFFGLDETTFWFRYLLTENHGASEAELYELLLDLFSSDRARSGYRVARYIRPFLMSQQGLIRPYHRQFQLAIEKRYLGDLPDEERLMLHGDWSTLMMKRWQKGDAHALTVLPDHLFRAGKPEELYDLEENQEFKSLQEQLPNGLAIRQATQQIVLQTALVDGNGIKAVEAMTSPFHFRAKNLKYTPLEALKERNLDYALQVANEEQIEFSMYWHLLVAWQLHTQNQHQQVAYVLKKVEELANPIISSKWVLWIEDQDIDRTEQDAQDQLEWVAKLLGIFMVNYPVFESAALRICQDQRMMLLLVKHLIKEKQLAQASELLCEISSKDKLYGEMVIAFWSASEESEKSAWHTHFQQWVEEVEDSTLKAEMLVLLAKEMARNDCDELCLKTLELIHLPIFPNVIEDSPSDVRIHRILADGLLKMLSVAGERKSLKITFIDRLINIFKQRPSIHSNIDKWPTDHQYEDHSEGYRAHRQLIDTGLRLLEYLSASKEHEPLRELRSLLIDVVPESILELYEFTGKVQRIPHQQGCGTFGSLLKRALQFDPSNQLLYTALMSLLPWVREEFRKHYLAFVIHLRPQERESSFLDTHWHVMLERKKIDITAKNGFYDEALEMAYGLHEWMWRMEFNLIDQGYDEEVFEFNGHYFQALRKIAGMASEQGHYKWVNRVADYFDQPVRGKWILLENALQSPDEQAISFIEQSLVLERSYEYYPLSPDQIDLERRRNRSSFFRDKNLTHEQKDQIGKFFRYLLTHLHGEKIWRSFGKTKWRRFVEALRWQGKGSDIFFSWFYLFWGLVYGYLLIAVPIMFIPFVAIGYYFYQSERKKGFFNLLTSFFRESRPFQGVYLTPGIIVDDWKLPERYYLEARRVKTPEKSGSHRFMGIYNYQYDHPKRLMSHCIQRLVQHTLEIEEVPALEYAARELLSHQGQSYTDYRNMAIGLPHPATSPGIDTGSYGDQDQVLMQLIAILGHKRQYNGAFKWIQAVQDDTSLIAARRMLAEIQASHNDYVAMRRTLTKPIRKYQNQTMYTDHPYMDGSNAAILTGLYQIIEKIAQERNLDLAVSLAIQEEDLDRREKFLKRIEEVKTEIEAWDKKPELTAEQREEIRFWDNWDFEHGPYGSFDLGTTVKGRINQTCLKLKEHLDQQQWESFWEEANKISDPECRLGLQFACCSRDRAILQREYAYMQQVISELPKLESENEYWEDTAVVTLLSEMLPHLKHWYYESNSKTRWEKLYAKILSAGQLNLDRADAYAQLRFTINDQTALTEISFAWCCSHVEQGQPEEGIRIFKSIDPDLGYTFVPYLIRLLNEVKAGLENLADLLQHCQSNIKLLYKAIEGLQVLLPKEKLTEILIAMNVEGKRMDLYSHLRSVNPEDPVTFLKPMETSLYTGIGSSLINSHAFDHGLYYTLKGARILPGLETYERRKFLEYDLDRNWSLLYENKGMYDKAIQELQDYTHPDREGIWHHKRLANLFFDKYLYDSGEVTDLQDAIAEMRKSWSSLKNATWGRQAMKDTDDAQNELLLLAGRIAYQLNLEDRAAILIMNAFAFEPEFPYLHLVVELLIKREFYDEALKLNRLDGRLFSDLTPQLQQMECLIYLGRYEEVRRHTLLNREEEPPFLYRLVYDFFQLVATIFHQKQVEESLVMFEHQMAEIETGQLKKYRIPLGHFITWLETHMLESMIKIRILSVGAKLQVLSYSPIVNEFGKKEATKLFGPLDEFVDYSHFVKDLNEFAYPASVFSDVPGN